MPTKLSRTLAISLLALSLSASTNSAFAWTAPTATPPNVNVAKPINAGSTPQTKAGGFGALWAAFVDLLITGSIQGTDAVTGLATNLVLNPDGGNVGIGVTPLTGAMAAKFDVGGIIRSRTGSFQLHDGTTNGNGGGLFFHKTISGTGASIEPALFAEGTAGRIHFMTGGSATTKMLIDKDGNVGIGTGTTAPGAKLDVTGTVNATGVSIAGVQKNTVWDAKAPTANPIFTGTVTTPAIKITGGVPGVNKVLTSDAAGLASWATESDPTVSAWAKIGDTTTIPSAKISGSYPSIAGVGTITSGIWNGTSIADADISSAVTWNAKAPTASPTFTGSVTMPGSGIWNTSGNVGIGTTDPRVKLEVRGNVRSDNALKIYVGTVPRFPNFCISGCYNGAEVGGYAGGDAKCAAEYPAEGGKPAARMSYAGDFINRSVVSPPQIPAWYNTFVLAVTGTDHTTGPGTTAFLSASDCGGWQISSNARGGTWWGFPLYQDCFIRNPIACSQ